MLIGMFMGILKHFVFTYYHTLMNGGQATVEQGR